MKDSTKKDIKILIWCCVAGAMFSIGYNGIKFTMEHYANNHRYFIFCADGAQELANQLDSEDLENNNN